jgi:hypothetical protein
MLRLGENRAVALYDALSTRTPWPRVRILPELRRHCTSGPHVVPLKDQRRRPDSPPVLSELVRENNDKR